MTERMFVLVDFRYTSDVVGNIRLYEAGNTYDMPRALAHAAAMRELVALEQPVDWTPPSICDGLIFANSGTVESYASPVDQTVLMFAPNPLNCLDFATSCFHTDSRRRIPNIIKNAVQVSQMSAIPNQRLRELGYVEGQNLALAYVNPEHQAGGNAGAIEELLRRKVDIILVTYKSTLKAALGAGVTVPIVMVAVDYDPLALGYVKSLARPGGNVTGL